MTTIPLPVTLSISGHDPTGGAGIQADIETMSALGCIATSVVTCLTIQDTHNVQKLIPVDSELIETQVRALTADMTVSAIKIGLIGDEAIAEVIAGLLDDHPALPVVLDPVLAAGGGTDLAGARLLEKIHSRLLPRTTLLTPNSDEARRLSGKQELDSCAAALLAHGCGAVLITGAHESAPEVSNRLYRSGQPTITTSWPRLPYSYHGSGCTLASAVTALLALGRPLEEAVIEAQGYTWNALSHGFRPGRGQHLPDRYFEWRRQ